MRLYAISLSAIFTSQQLKLNPLDLADCDLVFGPVVTPIARQVKSIHPMAGQGTGKIVVGREK